MKTAISATHPLSTPAIAPASAAEARKGVWFMIASVACFTANTLLLRYVASFRGVDISLAIITRALVGTIIVFFFFNARRPLEVKAAILHPRLILRGLLGVAGTAAFYWTIPQLGAGKATLICTTYVLFAAIFAAIFLGEHLSRSKSASLLFAFAGIALLTGSDINGENPIGKSELIALGGALSAGWVVGLIRQLTVHYSNATIFFSQCFWIAVTLVPFAVLKFEWPGWISLGLLIAAATTASYGQIALVQALRHLEVAKGASIQMALPIAASIGGIVLFGETFTALQLAGAALTLLGTWRVVSART